MFFKKVLERGRSIKLEITERHVSIDALNKKEIFGRNFKKWQNSLRILLR